MAFGTVSADVIQSSVANTSLGAGNASIMKNRCINGAMVIDQRNAGASVTANDGVFGVDRFQYHATQSSKGTLQQNAGSITPPTGFSNYLGFTSSSAYSITSTDQFNIWQKIEGYNIADLGWGTANAKTVTLSFQVYSSLTGTFGGSIFNRTGARSYPFTYTISLANTWTTISITIAGDTSGSWNTDNNIGMYVLFGLGVGSTYSGAAGSWSSNLYYSATGATSVVGTNGATFYITGVQLEVGSSATGYEYRQYGQELALCQRYYQRYNADSSLSTFINGALCSSSTSGNGGCLLITTMRATPTLDSSAASTFTYDDGTNSTACTSVALAGSQSGTKIATLNFGTAGGLTQYRTYMVRASSTTSAYLGFSSEL